jgi:hypothetical protein
MRYLRAPPAPLPRAPAATTVAVAGVPCAQNGEGEAAARPGPAEARGGALAESPRPGAGARWCASAPARTWATVSGRRGRVTGQPSPAWRSRSCIHAGRSAPGVRPARPHSGQGSPSARPSQALTSDSAGGGTTPPQRSHASQPSRPAPPGSSSCASGSALPQVTRPGWGRHAHGPRLLTGAAVGLGQGPALGADEVLQGAPTLHPR